MCVCVCVCEQSTHVSGKKKFICTSYNMIDELANQSIVNNKIIIERIYNFSHSSSFQSITQIVYTVMPAIFRNNVLHRSAVKRPLLW